MSDEAMGSLVYHDSTMTDGGHLMMNKQFKFDSSNKGLSTGNLENRKLITYEGTEGSHLFAKEKLSMSTAGNYMASGGSYPVYSKHQDCHPFQPFVTHSLHGVP